MTAPLLTSDELAERWQVSPAHIYRLVRTNRIPVVRLGRYYRFLPEDIDQFERDGGVKDDRA